MTLEPGIYTDISEVDYHRIPLCSSSSLKEARETSLWRVRMRLNGGLGEKESTPAMGLGSAIDGLLLGTQEVVGINRSTKKGKEEALEAEERGALVISPSMFRLASLTVERCMSFPWAPEFQECVRRARYRQATLIWEKFGVLCKSRLDFMDPIGFILDLKTGEVDPLAFKKKLYNLGYAAQAAFYVDACKYHGIDVEAFYWGCVYTDGSGEVVTRQADEDVLFHGRHQYEHTLRQWALAEKSGEWPPREKGIVPVMMDDWQIRRIWDECGSGEEATDSRGAAVGSDPGDVAVPPEPGEGDSGGLHDDEEPGAQGV